MKDLTTYLQSTELADIDDASLAGAISESVEESGGAGGNFDFLSFSGKLGAWKYGRDNEGIDPDEYWLLEPSTVFTGWTCWKQAKVMGRHEWPVTKRETHAVAFEELEDHGPYRDGDGWKETWGFGMVRATTLRGAKFSSTSVSGCNSVKDLLLEVSSRMGRGEPSIPVMRLSESEFTAQEQTNWKPVFDVESWVTREEVRAFLLGEISIEQLIEGDVPKPRKKRVTKKKATARRR